MTYPPPLPIYYPTTLNEVWYYLVKPVYGLEIGTSQQQKKQLSFYFSKLPCHLLDMVYSSEL